MKSFNTTFKQRPISFTIQDPLIHTNWKNEILKQKNMATSLYWANVYQTGTYSKMLQKLLLKKLNIQKSKYLSQTTSLINIQVIIKNKQLQINSTPYTSILLHCLLSFPMSFLSLSLSIFLCLPFPSFLFSFLSFCLHPQKN